MQVRKVRGQDKVGKIILSVTECMMVKKFGIPVEDYVKYELFRIAKQRKWKWYLDKHKDKK
jgi:hypothetical protein